MILYMGIKSILSLLALSPCFFLSNSSPKVINTTIGFNKKQNQSPPPQHTLQTHKARRQATMEGGEERRGEERRGEERRGEERRGEERREYFQFFVSRTTVHFQPLQNKRVCMSASVCVCVCVYVCVSRHCLLRQCVSRLPSTNEHPLLNGLYWSELFMVCVWLMYS